MIEVRHGDEAEQMATRAGAAAVRGVRSDAPDIPGGPTGRSASLGDCVRCDGVAPQFVAAHGGDVDRSGPGMSVHAVRLAASGVHTDPESGLRTIIYDTTTTLPKHSDANLAEGYSKHRDYLKRKARRDLRVIGWGMYQAYSAGVRLDRARITIRLRVCRHWRATEAYEAYRPNDGDNLLRACKGLIDGIVAAGLLPDDKARHLEHGTPELAEVATPFDEGLHVTIEELPAAGGE